MFMARRRTNLLDDLATMPWQAGIILGLVGFALVRFGVPAFMSSRSGLLASAFTSGGVFTTLSWLWLLICLWGALLSWRKARHRRRLLQTRTDLDSLSAHGWREFEKLVGEAFRQQGFAVEETGLGGPDGGIDLILRKSGQRTLVQCKQWKRQQVGVAVVREMYGLLAHHRADAVKIVSIGTFSREAEAFIADKPIELIPGASLLQMIHAVQRTADASPTPLPQRQPPTMPPGPPLVPACPRCGSSMVERRNRQTGATFLGCSRFPACRGSA